MGTPTHQDTEKVDSTSSAPIAIVGGGITGLFCAYVLASTGHRVELFESSNEFGGRIRSFLLNRKVLDDCAQHEGVGKPRPIKDQAGIEDLRVKAGVEPCEYENLEFCAEFGPMRVELEVQVLLRFLLEHLGIVVATNPEGPASTQSGQSLARGTKTEGGADSAPTEKARAVPT